MTISKIDRLILIGVLLSPFVAAMRYYLRLSAFYSSNPAFSVRYLFIDFDKKILEKYRNRKGVF